MFWKKMICENQTLLPRFLGKWVMFDFEKLFFPQNVVIDTQKTNIEKVHFWYSIHSISKRPPPLRRYLTKKRGGGFPPKKFSLLVQWEMETPHPTPSSLKFRIRGGRGFSRRVGRGLHWNRVYRLTLMSTVISRVVARFESQTPPLPPSTS